MNFCYLQRLSDIRAYDHPWVAFLTSIVLVRAKCRCSFLRTSSHHISSLQPFMIFSMSFILFLVPLSWRLNCALIWWLNLIFFKSNLTGIFVVFLSKNSVFLNVFNWLLVNADRSSIEFIFNKREWSRFHFSDVFYGRIRRKISSQKLMICFIQINLGENHGSVFYQVT